MASIKDTFLSEINRYNFAFSFNYIRSKKKLISTVSTFQNMAREPFLNINKQTSKLPEFRIFSWTDIDMNWYSPPPQVTVFFGIKEIFLKIQG